MKAVPKRIYREGTREYGAKNEKATEMRSQQECILSGGVYLRHHLKDNFCLSYYQSIAQPHKGVQDRRSGVLACKKLSPDST